MYDDIVDRRAETYGEPVDQYRRIALVWSGILGIEVQPFEAALMMAGMKMVRAQHTPDYSDNTDDVDGYIEIARKIVGPDMIEARSVEEYIAKKFPVITTETFPEFGVNQHLVDNATQGTARVVTLRPHVHQGATTWCKGGAECPGIPNGDGDVG